MKKIIFLGLLGSLLLLASCGTSTSKSEASANSSTTSTTNETTSVEETSDTKIKESISSAENHIPLLLFLYSNTFKINVLLYKNK